MNMFEERERTMNARTSRLPRGLRAALAAAAVGFAGCTDYDITTTIDRDGGGRRSEVLRVSSGENEQSIAADDYVYLLGLGEESGWSHRTEADDDTKHVFERTHRIRDAKGWAGLTGSVRLHGTTPVHASERVGRVTLGDVGFSNRVEVGRTRSTGGDTVTYRESFVWKNGPDPIVEYFAASVTDAIAARYSRISAAQRGELEGMTRAGLWSVIDAGLLGPGSEVDDTVLLERFVSRTGYLAAAAIRPAHPDVRPEDLAAILRREIDDEERLGGFLKTKVPGLDLAGAVGIELRLILPGRVVDSNAASVKGDTLVWEIDPAKALAAPIEAFATSVVEER